MNALNTQISCVNAGSKQTNRKRSHVRAAKREPFGMKAEEVNLKTIKVEETHGTRKRHQ
jgi:hypothetical protein